ncbi:hypothetical protein BJX63DRAFT_444997 [Aspergillus granulosus]|uniref:Xylanolytic transcriptional activator regulatory domain-containing protein n=1 Tax=Aspergillus granulosus TaxID=176169 RepID=A0ABR4HX55_9EURO
MHTFVAVVPEFSPPSRHTMTRYLATYFSGFHRHLPFFHIPTFSPIQCLVELLLVMAAIGAQSAFDNDNAVMFFRTSHAIVMGRLRRRKDELRRKTIAGAHCEPRTLDVRCLEHCSSIRDSVSNADQFDPLPAAQTLLLLMAIATWGNSNAIYNEAFGLQNTLTKFVREEKLLERQTEIPNDITWHEWIDIEGFQRTIAIIYCFFVFHTIVYDILPPILNSELNIHLPSREKDWDAPSEKDWCRAREEPKVEQPFQSSLSSLFTKRSNEGTESPKGFSSLGGYTLILAMIQHIYFLRETRKYKPRSEQNISPTDVAEVEQALKNWQSAWYSDPESSLNPGSPQGPIPFNSTALLRMAYPRAVLYSAHALSIPVKIGVNIVARNQAFTWSLQHALCALECAFVLSKWLVAIHRRPPSVLLDEDESRLLAYIVDMVVEADPGFRLTNNIGATPHLPNLCARVIKIWAKLLSGEAVWDVVRMIGKALNAYSQILERQAAID